MSDLNIAVPNNAPQNNSNKPIPINIIKTTAVEDLRATFQTLKDNFNIQTPAFYVKLGDLMMSSQSFSVSAFKERFFNLLNEYSQGVVFEGVSGGQTKAAFPTGAIGVPDEAKRNGTSYVNYVGNQSNALIPETDPVKTFDDPLQKTSTDDVLIGLKDTQEKDVKPTDILIDNMVNQIFTIANKTGTTNNIDIFLYNTIPIIAGGALNAAATSLGKAISTATGKPTLTNPSNQSLSATDLIGAVAGVVTGQQGNPLDAFFSGRYFTVEELMYITGANFYTLINQRGISIKDLTTGPGVIFNPNIIFAKPDFISASKKSESPFPRGKNGWTIELLAENVDSRNTESPSIKNEIDTYLNQSNTSETSAAARDFRRNIIDMDLSKTRNNRVFKWIDKDGNKSEGVLGSLEQQEREARGVWNIGSVYVWPVDSVNAGSPSVIPFEFNPSVSEGDVAAKYNSMSILSRIGDLQSYASTGSLSVSISTSYWALSEKDDDFTSDQLTHLSYFSLERLQKIELGFRSLVLPFFPQEQSKETGFKYTRPPLIKIIMGNYQEVQDEETDTPYSNLLLYPTKVIGDRFKNIQVNKFRRFKTFICTSVKIDKNFETYPIYMKNNSIKDTMGFNVDLSLIEVSPSYIQALPSFSDFFSQADLTALV